MTLGSPIRHLMLTLRLRADPRAIRKVKDSLKFLAGFFVTATVCLVPSVLFMVTFAKTCPTSFCVRESKPVMW